MCPSEKVLTCVSLTTSAVYPSDNQRISNCLNRSACAASSQLCRCEPFSFVFLNMLRKVLSSGSEISISGNNIFLAFWKASCSAYSSALLKCSSIIFDHGNNPADRLWVFWLNFFGHRSVVLWTQFWVVHQALLFRSVIKSITSAGIIREST